jgi:hypothetical protein
LSHFWDKPQATTLSADRSRTAHKPVAQIELLGSEIPAFRERKPEMSTKVEMSAIPDSDVCRSDGKTVAAYADAKLSIGPWAYVCKEHFTAYACSLGTGRGQELVLGGEQK